MDWIDEGRRLQDITVNKCYQEICQTKADTKNGFKSLRKWMRRFTMARNPFESVKQKSAEPMQIEEPCAGESNPDQQMEIDADQLEGGASLPDQPEPGNHLPEDPDVGNVLPDEAGDFDSLLAHVKSMKDESRQSDVVKTLRIFHCNLKIFKKV